MNWYRAGVIITRVLFFVALAYLTYGTLTPAPQDVAGMGIVDWIAQLVLNDPMLGDKVGHFIGYAVLCGLFIFGWAPRFAGGLALVLGLAGYGVMLEWAQGAMGSRQMDPADAIANFSGAVVAWPIATLFRWVIVKAIGAETY